MKGNWLMQGTRSARRGALLLAASFCLLGAPYAQADTLEDALAAAYQSNPNLLAARAELRGTDETVNQALGGYRPQVTGEVGGGYVSGRSSSDTLTSSSGGTGLAQLSVRQPIYNYSTSHSVSQAEHSVRADRAHLKAVEADVLTQAVQAYAGVAFAQTVLEATTSNARILQGDLDSAERRLKQGALSDADVSQAETSLASARAKQAQAEADLSTARQTYASVIGNMPGTVKMPDAPTSLPATRDEMFAALESNPDIVAAQFAERAASQGVGVSLGNRLPSVDLEGRAQPEASTALVVVRIPIFDGTTDSQVRQAKELVGQRRMELEAQRRTVQQVAAEAWNQFAAAKANIAAFEAQVKSANRAADGVRRQERLGLRTIADVTTAQQQVLDATVSLVGARRDALVAGMRVLAAVGRLDAQSLNLNVTPYDPNAHYQQVRGKWWGLGSDVK
jgi:TolC family type I secretion outer membrane protein